MLNIIPICRQSGVPDLPEARGKLCAAYDPSGAVIVCGGGERFWRPNANCWQLVAGQTYLKFTYESVEVEIFRPKQMLKMFL